MHKTFGLILFSAIFLIPQAFAARQPATSELCPDTTQGETTQDCPWAGMTRTLGERIDAHEPLDFNRVAPEIAKQLEKDSGEKELKNLWGKSINFDELAKGIIVRPEILKAIAHDFRVPFPVEPSTTPNYDRIAMAGMEHTYGYLFSILKTAYGYKRARWVAGEVETGFGFPLGVFGADASKFDSTLFGDVTIFAGNIAFRDNPEQLKIIRRHKRYASKLVQDFDFSNLKITRLTEIIEATANNPRVEIHTDLVPFIHPNAANPTGDQYILVYSINSKLVTMFPVAQSSVDGATAAANLGEGKTVITQYNGFVRDVSGKMFTGTRKVSQP
jgi:hypothetical protein